MCCSIITCGLDRYGKSCRLHEWQYMPACFGQVQPKNGQFDSFFSRIMVVVLGGLWWFACIVSGYTTYPGVDLGGNPLSRAPQISRRDTRFAGTVIRPGYQFLPRFGDLILGLASLLLTNMFKQIKQIRITLMTMFKVHTS